MTDAPPRSKMAKAMLTLEPHLEPIMQRLEEVIDDLRQAHRAPDLITCLMSMVVALADEAGHRAQVQKNCRALLTYFLRQEDGDPEDAVGQELGDHLAALGEVFGDAAILDNLIVFYVEGCAQHGDYLVGAQNCEFGAARLRELAAGTAHQGGHA